jgi:hypothetical protein
MKKVVFFVLCIAVSISAFPQNLVINSGFDNWSRTDKPANWNNTQGCLKDSVYAVTGNYSCRQEATSKSRDLGQKFAVTPGTNYRLSFFYFTGSETSGNGCRVWCSWLDNSQNGIADPVIHSTFLKSESWQKYEAALTSPETAGYFYLLVRTLPNSVTYWDDFVFEEDIATSIKETTKHDIEIYPNPASDYLTIKNIPNIQSVDVMSIAGSIKWSVQFSGEEVITIPVFGLPKGLYILRIISFEKTTILKFIKI